MKHPITLRLDPDLLAQAKRQAGTENRTLTNFIETLLKERLGAASASGQLARPARKHPEQEVAASGRDHLKKDAH